MKKLIGLILTIAVALVSTPTSAGAEQWQPFRDTTRNTTTVGMVDSNAAIGAQSRVLRIDQSTGRDESEDCLAFGEDPCTPPIPGKKIHYLSWVVLPLCDSAAQLYCVKGLNVYETGSEARAAAFTGEAAETSVVPNLKFGLPASGGSLLFEAPGMPHLGEAETYSVSAVVTLVFEPGDKKFWLDDFAVVVTPYTELNGYRQSEDFSPGTRVGVTLNMPSEASGWFSGRLKDPQISMKPLSSAVNELKIDGESLLVPRLEASVPASKFTPLMKELKMRLGGGSAIESGTGTGVAWVDQLRPFVQDRAVGETTVWNIRSSPVYDQPCFTKNRFNGIVTTNAIGYSWNPPKLVGSTLDYKVGGLHLNLDGTLAQGSYDLVLDSKVARCLYGFSSAPISATVSVTSGVSGEKNVATTLVSEIDGWLKLSAYGFHYSSPIIKVALTQNGVAKTTITCIAKKNAKLTKRVTAVAPKCPTGYKKK